MMSRSKMPLGDWLTELEGSNLTEAEVGLMFGFSQTAIWKMRKGTRNIDVRYLGYDESRGHKFELSETKVLGIGFHPYLD